jgi:hypothetical protein
VAITVAAAAAEEAAGLSAAAACSDVTNDGKAEILAVSADTVSTWGLQPGLWVLILKAQINESPQKIVEFNLWKEQRGMNRIWT